MICLVVIISDGVLDIRKQLGGRLSEITLLVFGDFSWEPILHRIWFMAL